jgi:hypothetical protein
LARRKGDTWYVAGINGMDTSQDLEFDGSFLANGDYAATLFFDHEEKSSPWDIKTINYSLRQQKGQKVVIPTQPRGGFVIVVRPNK